MSGTITMADLFCGAGGTSTGAIQALRALGFGVDLTAVNHWDVAVATHHANHPAARTLCTGVDDLDPRKLFPSGLGLLWASPECTHHSVARGGRPINDQSRATAWCVARWAESMRPDVILVENVPEFQTWGGLGVDGRPMASKKGATFGAWLAALCSLGYRVDYRVLCAADYGDPTTRRRLFVQAVRGRRKIVWPNPTHSPNREDGLFGQAQPWRAAREIIDWSIPAKSIFGRKKPLSQKTLDRIDEGLRRFWLPAIVAMEHGGRVLSADEPMPTITCAKGGAFGVAYLLPQQSCGLLRPVGEPVPTISTAGAIGLVVEYYGNGGARPVTEPLPTITCKDRFGLVEVDKRDIRFRMLQPHELAAAQGFPRDYQFAGNKTEQVRQIGNAVPCGLARALVAAVWSQQNDVSAIVAKAAEVAA